MAHEPVIRLSPEENKLGILKQRFVVWQPGCIIPALRNYFNNCCSLFLLLFFRCRCCHHRCWCIYCRDCRGPVHSRKVNALTFGWCFRSKRYPKKTHVSHDKSLTDWLLHRLLTRSDHQNPNQTCGPTQLPWLGSWSFSICWYQEIHITPKLLAMFVRVSPCEAPSDNSDEDHHIAMEIEIFSRRVFSGTVSHPHE